MVAVTLFWALLFSVATFAVRAFLKVVKSRSAPATDITAVVAGRAGEEIAGQIAASGVRIFRSDANFTPRLATSQYVFPRTNVYLKYDPGSLDPDVETFLIAHELSQVREHAPSIALVYTSVGFALLALAGVIAEAFLPPVARIIGWFAIFLTGFYAILTPIMKAVRHSREARADAAAATILGRERALRAMELLREALPEGRYRSILQADLTSRAARLAA